MWNAKTTINVRPASTPVNGTPLDRLGTPIQRQNFLGFPTPASSSTSTPQLEQSTMHDEFAALSSRRENASMKSADAKFELKGSSSALKRESKSGSFVFQKPSIQDDFWNSHGSVANDNSIKANAKIPSRKRFSLEKEVVPSSSRT